MFKKQLYTQFTDLTRSITCNVSGNVALLVAITIPVILVLIGGAIDFGRATQLRAQLQDSADVASLGSVAVNSLAYKTGLTMGDGEIVVGETQAVSIFNSDMPARPELSGTVAVAKVNKVSTLISSVVTVSTNYRPYMLGLIGMTSIPMHVTSTSSVTIPPYIDFYLLLDNSPSMGVGATTTDINTMVNNTSDKCAFACHQRDLPNNDYYALAKKLGVTTRIDVVRQATQNLMTTAKTTATLPNQYRMAIYDFGLAADSIDQKAPVAYQVSALSNDLTASATNAAAIDLMIMPNAGYNSDSQTNFKSTITSMNTIMPSPGTGLTAASPQKVLFLVTDGANDSYDCAYSNGNTCRRITPIDTAICTTIKARGIRIAVLYTTYLPLPTNSFYNTYLAKYVAAPSQLASQLQACASSGLYFEVGPNQGISEAMTALFNKVVSVVRINS